MAGFACLPDASLLLVIDVQERFLPAIPGIAADQPVGRRIRQLIAGAALFPVPLLFTEQYPKGLGPTLSDLRALAPDAPCLPKVAFSAVEDPAIAEQVARVAATTVVLCGIEAHVCVLATAADLLQRGHQVIIAGDAVASRHEASCALALSAARDLGALVLPTESILFRWQRVAGTTRFKELSGLVR